MKLLNWLIFIFGVIALVIAILWLNGTIEKYWLRYAIEHGDQDRIVKLLRAGVNPNVYD